MRNKALTVIKDHGFPIGAVVTAVLVIIYIYQVASSGQQLVFGEVFKAAVEIIFKSLTMMGSFFAFGLVCLLEKAKWGDAEDYRTYVAIGALTGFVSSLLLLLGTFQVITIH